MVPVIFKCNIIKYNKFTDVINIQKASAILECNIKFCLFV